MIRPFTVLMIFICLMAAAQPAQSRFFGLSSEEKQDSSFAPAAWSLRSFFMKNKGDKPPQKKIYMQSPEARSQRKFLSISDFSPKSGKEILDRAKALRAPQMEALRKMMVEKEYQMAKTQAALAEYEKTRVWEQQQAAKKPKDKGLKSQSQAQLPWEEPAKPKKKVIYNRPSGSETPNKVFKNYR